MSRLAILALLVAASGLADSVELKSGERIDGVFKRADSSGVVVEVAGQQVTIAIDKVRLIRFGAVEATASAPPPAAPIKDALDALRSLRSVTQSGIDYRQYSTRVLDAKVKVDALAGEVSPAAVAAIASMRYYQLASNAWGSYINKGASSYAIGLETGKALQELVPDCQPLAIYVSNLPKKDENYRAGVTSMLVGQRPSVLWACAAAKLAEAEATAK